jgi:group II intron reverse transcriptase/maturase
MAEVRRRENRTTAFNRVQATQGAPGLDGMTVEALPASLRKAWPSSRAQRRNATYEPAPVRTVSRPKPGGGTRRLGMPTVRDRLIAQAILPVRGPICDPDVSARRDGFRPGRSAHQARQHMGHDSEERSRGVVHMDLEQFCDLVHHDMVMRRGARKGKDKRLLKRLRRSLNAGLMPDGLVRQRAAGRPHGRPRSPLRSNGLLDDVDQALERRGHRFCRDADDAHVYVRRQRAGERVMASLPRFLEERRRLQVNRSTSGGLVRGLAPSWAPR